jgi:hypothetical protein
MVWNTYPREQIQWEQLTEIDVWFLDREEFLDVLQSCRALVKLVAGTRMTHYDQWVMRGIYDFWPEEQVDLRHLQELEIDVLEPGRTTIRIAYDMLNIIAAPTLTRLSICAFCDGRFLAAESFRRFFESTGSTIVDLELADRTPGIHPFNLDGLSRIPHLKRLSILGASAWTDSLVAHFAADPVTGNATAPELEHLEFGEFPEELGGDHRFIDRLKAETIKSMVLSRIKHPEVEGQNILGGPLAVAPLRVVELRCVTGEEYHKLEELEHLYLESSDFTLEVAEVLDERESDAVNEEEA